MDNSYLKKTVISFGYYCIFTICVFPRICCGERCRYTSNYTETEINCINTLQVNSSRNTPLVVIPTFQESVVISNYTFSGPRWENIRLLNITCGTARDPSGQIVVKAYGFSELKSLVYLRLHCVNIILEENAFYGLNQLTILDLSHSANLSPRELVSNLNIEHLGNLTNLLLVQTGISAREGFDMGDEFWNFIGKSRISSLDASMTNIRNFNVTSYCIYGNKLMTFRVSGAHFTTVHASMQRRTRCRLHDLISEGTIIDTVNLYCPNSKGYVDSKIVFDLKQACIFPKAKYYAFKMVCVLKDLTLKMNGLSLKPGFKLQSTNRLNISQLTLVNNDLGTILGTADNPFITRSTLVSLSITRNKIRFIAQGAISHTTTLVSLDLSYNNLQDMNKRYRLLFENLLSPFFKLGCIVLVRNSLKNIPEKMFLKNYRLEEIRLANNMISKITFKIAHLRYLRYLDLRHNRIRVLEGSTMSVFQSLFETPLPTGSVGPRGIHMDRNPLSCCDYTFIKWLQAYSKHMFRFEEEVTCIDEHGAVTNVANKTLDKSCTVIDANGESDNKKILIEVALVLSPLLLVVLVKALRHYKSQQINNRGDKDAMKSSRYSCVVFLSFSSEDDVFIDTKVANPLTQCIRQRIKQDIKPVGTGDTMFRAGMYIHDEIISSLEQSKVMIILLTDNYCRSECCVMEFQKAIQINKPIIIMVKDKVDKTLLTPAMRMSYNKNTRIIWTKHEGDYVLKSTWNTICDSIMELGAKPVQNQMPLNSVD